MTSRPSPPPDGVPCVVAAMLRRARDAERVATGAQRRPAFRLTRSLLGGARVVGYPATELARCLEISVSAARDRSGSDGWITTSQLIAITGASAAQVRCWCHDGLLPQRRVGPAGQDCYLASDVIRAVPPTADS